MLESVEGGAVLGRYSAIGLDPDLIWTYKKGEKINIKENGETREDTLGPLASFRAQITLSQIDIVDESSPPMGPSGLFGYMGYDCVRLIEDIPDNNPDVLNVPESIMMRPTLMVIFDNVKNMMCLITPVRAHASNCDKSAEHHFDKASRILAGALNLLSQPIDQTMLHSKSRIETPLKPKSNMTRDAFHTMVKKAKDYILAGDIFQVVPSQRFSVDFDLPAFDLYRSLRRLNPSPFLFYINFDGFALVGSSPEILVRLRDNKMTIRPIAGTRKRGIDAAEDKALQEDLLGDPKEISEHLMLLDLGRNDIGRVSENSTVDVTDQFTVEHYSHVMHIVSNVEGDIQDGLDCIDALMAGFPAGTVSGAPKVRAMEIIDELEDEKRGI
jgi:anthranilate synthase component 1